MRWYVCSILLFCAVAHAADWPQWGHDASRNMVSPEKNLPDTFDLGCGRGATTRNVKWMTRLGTQTYGNPVVAGGRVYVGTNAESPFLAGKCKGGGAVLCFDETTGKLLWHREFPKYIADKPNLNFDHLNSGVCSSPAADGDRVYVVNNRAELLCLDAATGATKWSLDFINNPAVGIWPQDAVDCSVLIHGDCLYVCPSNGVDKSHVRIPHPNAPSIVAVEKLTGKILATDDAHIGPRIFHGEWSSPALLELPERTLVIHGGGDGWCYAFDAKPTPGPAGKQLLKTIWKCDANPPGARQQRYKTRTGPSEIIATPVVNKNRVYVAVGQDPAHGVGQGNLVCIDATRSGDVTRTGIVWSYPKIDRSISTVAIADGLLYAADFSGTVHCLDPETGKALWTFDAESRIWGSPLAADGKIYFGTDSGHFYILAAGREQKLIRRIILDSKMHTTPVAANDRLFFATKNWLYAIGK